jgi:MFS family permease
VAGRFEGRYGLAVMLALLGLCPEIVISTAALPLDKVVAGDLGSSPLQLQLTNGLSNAGYAFGAVLAAQLAQRYVARHLFLGYEGLFVLGSVVAAVAPTTGVFFAGRLTQGTATGLMLIAALPPLVTRFGVNKLPWTVVIVDIGMFGATALGPFLGGMVGHLESWRWVFWAAAVAGALGWLAAWLGYVRFEPLDPDLPFDRPAVTLALVGTGLTFTGASMLITQPFTSVWFWAPFGAGLAAIVLLIVVEMRRERPLMPIEALSTQLPVTGIIVAMVGGATFTSIVMLLQTAMQKTGHVEPLSAGWAFWPAPIALLAAAGLFGLLVRTKYLPLLVVVGLAALAAAALVLLVRGPVQPGSATAVTSALLGFGAGATVSPGLFLTGFGVPSKLLGRAFALVQLLRSQATFAVAPLVLAVPDPQAAIAVTLGIALLGLGSAVVIPALSGARLRTPDLEAWLERGERAMVSPTTGVHVRRTQDEEAEPLLPRRRR